MSERDIGKLLQAIFPKERIKCKFIDLVAYASDAGFYYLRPKAVVLPMCESEIVSLFAFSKAHKIPVVFRAAGTSLSGQSITDGILVDLSQHWDKVTVENDGESVRVKPGAIGAMVNAVLKKKARKIGPDPASINSAMIGGILSNNASGMCCGVAGNSYHTTEYLRFILPNGKTYTTEVAADYLRFENECPELYKMISIFRDQIAGQPAIYHKIRTRYKTKNTVGYAVNAFIDFNEPLDILARLLIGAEGTLGFIAEAVMKTVHDYPLKSTAMLYFPDIYSACQAIIPLTISGAAAVELMDRASLKSVEEMAGMPEMIKTLPDQAAALLIEYQGNFAEELDVQIAGFLNISGNLALINKAEFTTVYAEQALLWKVRKGMFPAVGAVRASGTTVILEDIAFPVATLGDAILDLQLLFKKHGYDKAIIFGHAKDGNIHFVITQAFDTKSEIERYDCFINDVVYLVVNKYRGTLKAEHGTGRNMAPFVATEWGDEIYSIMKGLKSAVDPNNLLNPGVIINADRAAHITHLKALTQVEDEVDRCMECGFCEYKCPSRNLTLTPRKRIVVRRELKSLKNKGYKKEYKILLQEYQYQGLDTCAVDGLCATTCPVDINTGDLIKRLRRESHSVWSNKIAVLISRNFRMVSATVKFALVSGTTVNQVLGCGTMFRLTKAIKNVIPGFPLWSDQLTLAGKLPESKERKKKAGQLAVVYFPTCISRVMGEAVAGDKGVMQTFMDVSAKAGIDVVLPAAIEGSCCGQIYSSKGFKDAYCHTVNLTIGQLWESTRHGELPVVLDITSCTQTLQNCRIELSEENKIKFDGLKIMDSVAYLHDLVMPRVVVSKKKAHVVLHPVCSLQKMPGLGNKFEKLAAHFSIRVTLPLFSGCCGMAGDRGFLYPELTRAATLGEANEAKQTACDGYYSSSKTCEIALSNAVGKNYKSILMLVDECSLSADT
jgi:D-lactate dehydrogenase